MAESNQSTAGDVEEGRAPATKAKRKTSVVLTAIFVVLAAIAIALGVVYGMKGPTLNTREAPPLVGNATNSTIVNTTSYTTTTTTTTTTPPYTGPSTTTTLKPITLQTEEGPVNVKQYSSCDDLKVDILTTLRDMANTVIADEMSNDWFAKCNSNDTELKYPWWYQLPKPPTDETTLSSSLTTETEAVNDDGNADILVTQGNLMFAVYSNVLFAWNASIGASGVSSTRVIPEATGCVTETGKRGRNLRASRQRQLQGTIAMHDFISKQEDCIPTLKSRVVELLIHETRLVVVISEENGKPSAISKHSSNLIKVFNISSIPRDGSPLKLLGETEIQGNFNDAAMVDSTGIIQTTFPINTWFFIEDLYRYQPQYCGLSTADYKKLATDIALSSAITFLDEMAEEMDLDLGCERVYHMVDNQNLFDDAQTISSSSDHLGVFVRISSFNVSSDFQDGQVPVNSVGAFSQSEYLDSTMTSLINTLGK